MLRRPFQAPWLGLFLLLGGLESSGKESITHHGHTELLESRLSLEPEAAGTHSIPPIPLITGAYICSQRGRWESSRQRGDQGYVLEGVVGTGAAG